MSLLALGFTRTLESKEREERRAFKKAKTYIEESGSEDEGNKARDSEYEDKEAPVSDEEPAETAGASPEPRAKARRHKKQRVDKVKKKKKKDRASDEQIDQLLAQLRAHPHRDRNEDNLALKELLDYRLQECERLTQYHRFEERGFSAFESLPREVLERIAHHLHDECSKSEFKRFAFLSKPFSLVIRSLVWRKIFKFRTGTITKLRNDLLPSVSQLIRYVNACVSSREAQIVIAAAHEIESFTLNLHKAPNNLSKCLTAALNKHHKRLSLIELDGGWKEYNNSLDIDGLQVLPSLQTLHLDSLRFTAATADSFLAKLAKLTALVELRIEHCGIGRLPTRVAGAMLMEDSDDEMLEGLPLDPVYQLPAYRFTNLEKICLKSVAWSSPFGFTLLQIAGNKLQKVHLEFIYVFPRAQQSQVEGSGEVAVLAWEHPFALVIKRSDRMLDIVDCFPLQFCSAIDIQSISGCWSPVSVHGWKATYRQYCTVLERLVGAMKASKALKKCRVVHLHRDGILSRAVRDRHELQTLYEANAKAIGKLERLAEDHGTDLDILRENALAQPPFA